MGVIAITKAWVSPSNKTGGNGGRSQRVYTCAESIRKYFRVFIFHSTDEI